VFRHVYITQCEANLRMGCDQENVGFDPAFSLFNMESVKNSFGFLDLKTKTRAFRANCDVSRYR